MLLIDNYLPDYQFRERHSLVIAASPTAVMAAAKDYRPESDAFFRRMISLRELPMRVFARLQAAPRPLPQAFGMHNFTLLEQQDHSELVFGLTGRFWHADYGLVAIDGGDAFCAYNESGVAKLVLGFTAEAWGDGQTRLFTETRVFCPDRASVRRFTPYWYLIRPVSGLIRRRMLASIAQLAANKEQQ